MRAVALVLVLSFTGPAVATVVCEWVCAESRHHQVSAASEGCQGHAADPQVPGIGTADAAACHHGPKVEPAVTQTAVHLVPIPAVTDATLRGAGDDARSPAVVVAATIRPPGLIPITTTQLRV